MKHVLLLVCTAHDICCCIWARNRICLHIQPELGNVRRSSACFPSSARCHICRRVPLPVRQNTAASASSGNVPQGWGPADPSKQSAGQHGSTPQPNEEPTELPKVTHNVDHEACSSSSSSSALQLSCRAMHPEVAQTSTTTVPLCICHHSQAPSTAAPLVPCVAVKHAHQQRRHQATHCCLL
jgi:hypothetical protein